MAVILAHPAASNVTTRLAARAPRPTRSCLLLGLVPLLLANASWDAVTFLGAQARPAVHASASACA